MARESVIVIIASNNEKSKLKIWLKRHGFGAVAISSVNNKKVNTAFQQWQAKIAVLPDKQEATAKKIRETGLAVSY